MSTTKKLGYLCVVDLILTLLWLGLLIADTASAGSLVTFEQVLAHVGRLNGVFYLTYLNAALITVVTMMLMAGLYRHVKSIAPEYALWGLVFVPVYGTLNLVVYLSQVTVVPGLLTLRAQAEYQAVAEVLLRQVLQSWPISGVAFFNNLAYALLGIPSFIFGVILARQGGLLRMGGLLLALSGVASLVGVVGILVGSVLLSSGSVVGGVLFLVALILFSLTFLKSS